ncbi:MULTISPECIES: chemotaxis protein [Corallincola]|uniref:Chemotaxis signal transduction protein CheV n=2 Tax=Corallincola TaxID=1775176 RepID=A0ABY1WPD9_9GAMM|nr:MULTISPECIES: chemotaxis protein [Corallincola]TAA45955.1 chemotaxis signal transduction protein CheV [Corallincola spongiicola]TCI04063.1 chemotaxis signal transduction protein CheV [Corallincola luteus]
MNNPQDRSNQGLLQFFLSNKQPFAIATLKVREIVNFQALTQLPHSHPAILGATTLRDETISIIDMAMAIGYPPVAEEDLKNCSIIVTEFSRKQTGFLVRGIDKIIEAEWQKIAAPPASLGAQTYITGVIRSDAGLVQIIDVEKILEEIEPPESGSVSTDYGTEDLAPLADKSILLVDDSLVARKQISHALDDVGASYFVTNNGHEALAFLQEMANEGGAVDIVVSDIEMPLMDGYELTREIRRDPRLSKAYVILHTSLSSTISMDQAKDCGADKALTKFNANDLIHTMLEGARHGRQS